MPLAEGAGRQPFVVVANGPNLTAEGRRLRDLGWVEPNLAMDLFLRPEVRGRSEYLRLRSGAQVLGRIFRNGRWQYTARGREFYQRQLQIVVRIPVVERGNGDRQWEVANTFSPSAGRPCRVSPNST